MINKKQQQGITLLEIMLVIVIIGSILYFSVQQYLSYRASADTYQVRANVDVIFNARGSYYKNNCYGQTSNDPSVPTRWGSLNPNFSPSPLDTPNFPIDLNEDLRNNGFLNITLPVNPFIDATPGVGTSGYVTQFNLKQSTRYACIKPVTEGVKITTANDCAQTMPIGTIISWQAQVAVKLKDVANARTFLNALGGDCLSSASGNIVQPCSANATGPYVVWQRAPSLGSLYNNSPYWSFNHVVTQFTNLYRTYNGPYLMETGGITPGNNQQYFVCGD